MKLVLSTSNIMGRGPTVMRRPTIEKSNAELTNTLRANFTAQKELYKPAHTIDSPNTNSDFKAWTQQIGSTLYIPSLENTETGLIEERAQYDITVKLFFLPNIPASRRRAQAKEAVDFVLNALKVTSIDLLIVSFPGIAFDADDEDSDSDVDSSEEAHSSPADPEDIPTMLETWRTLEELHDVGVIGKLGLAEFGTQRLNKLLPQTRVRPSVNQINLRDCCVVPKPLILFAKKEKIELLTHNDCTDILPRGTLRELLGSGQHGVEVLADPNTEDAGRLDGDVEPEFVVKYTAVIKDRGVVENKGYFAVAELKASPDMNENPRKRPLEA
ncbi:putative gamma-cysteine synthetase regulatory subunit [Pseudovirgaria hyperparasitica]|uniref:GCS light chain n=1 Tax=Pseudovirgaria hyperparasitica TaxID=470096 RepID=A0A6A6WA19_9PEZI|nr:putative gamma-cysteine synthetase regulatory subunit [Pseudovirgaria hyperparasitica]KAF2759009.1 putative gamma-cysteine synthetase regulatory subunit [Pseudovirgaria hyperparasitica]